MRAGLILAGGLVAFASNAQTTTPGVFTSERFPDLPVVTPGPLPDHFIARPRATAPADRKGGAPFLLKGIDFAIDGTSPISEEALRAAAAPLIGRNVTIGDLNELRRLLSEALIAAGYISSGVTIPDQEVADGIVTMRIVIGRLTRLIVTGAGIGEPGLGVLSTDYLTEQLAISADEPFNLSVIEEKIRVILEDRNVDKVTAAVRPGTTLGETTLDVDVTSKRPFDLALELSNGGFPASGREMAEATGAFRNLIGWGDEIRASAFGSKGAYGGRLAFDGPIPGHNLTPYLLVEAQRSRVIEAPLDDLGIRSRNFSLDLGVKRSFIKSSRRKLDISAQFSLKRTRTTLSGQPFSFSPGVDRGRTKLSVLSLIGEFVERRSNATFAARAAVNFGLDVFGVTDTGPGAPDGKFVSLLGQAQAVIAFDRDLSLRLGLQAQLADGPLLPSADISIGGRSTVRGYREAAVVADQAFVVSAELTHAFGSLAIPGITPAGYDAAVTASAFVDFGYAWDVGQKGDSLAGTGVGIAWAVSPSASIEIEAATNLAARSQTEGKSNKLGLSSFLALKLTY